MDRTRWRSHLGLPAHIILDSNLRAMEHGQKIPRANDSNIHPKIIYVSRNHSVSDDVHKSELYIPKRSASHESFVSPKVKAVTSKNKLSLKGGLKSEDVYFKPLILKSTYQPSTSPPPPLVSLRTPPPSVSSPPPPLPTTSPPPLDDENTTVSANTIPPTSLAYLPPPSPTPSFHGNHINIPGSTGHEDEILHYLDLSIAKENIVISESTQFTTSDVGVKGDNSSKQTDSESYLITKWDGMKAKTVRAFIKPGTVEELRELFQKLGQKYSKSSAIERKKMRMLLKKKRRPDINVQNIDFFRKDELPLIKTGIRKTNSTQSDISTTTTTSTEGSELESSASEAENKSNNRKSSSDRNSPTLLELDEDPVDVFKSTKTGALQDSIGKYLISNGNRGDASDPEEVDNWITTVETKRITLLLESKPDLPSKENRNIQEIGKGEIPNPLDQRIDLTTNNVIQLKPESNVNQENRIKNVSGVDSNTTNNKPQIIHTKHTVLSPAIDQSYIVDTTVDNKTFSESSPIDELKTLNRAHNSYLGQQVTGVTVSNVKDGLIGSYNSVRSSGNASKKSESGNYDYFTENEKPTTVHTLENYQKHTEKMSSDKRQMIDVDMDSQLAEQVKPAAHTRTTGVEIEIATESQNGKTSSASLGGFDSNSSSNDEEITLFHGSGTLESRDVHEIENRPLSPKDKYDNLLSELKKKTSVQPGHVTRSNITQIHSETSSAKFSVDSVGDKTDGALTTTDSSEDEQTYDLVDAARPAPKEQFDTILSEFKSLFSKKDNDVSSGFRSNSPTFVDSPRSSLDSDSDLDAESVISEIQTLVRQNSIEPSRNYRSFTNKSDNIVKPSLFLEELKAKAILKQSISDRDDSVLKSSPSTNTELEFSEGNIQNKQDNQTSVFEKLSISTKADDSELEESEEPASILQRTNSEKRISERTSPTQEEDPTLLFKSLITGAVTNSENEDKSDIDLELFATPSPDNYVTTSVNTLDNSDLEESEEWKTVSGNSKDLTSNRDSPTRDDSDLEESEEWKTVSGNSKNLTSDRDSPVSGNSKNLTSGRDSSTRDDSDLEESEEWKTVSGNSKNLTSDRDSPTRDDSDLEESEEWKTVSRNSKNYFEEKTFDRDSPTGENSDLEESEEWKTVSGNSNYIVNNTSDKDSPTGEDSDLEESEEWKSASYIPKTYSETPSSDRNCPTLLELNTDSVDLFKGATTEAVHNSRGKYLINNDNKDDDSDLEEVDNWKTIVETKRITLLQESKPGSPDLPSEEPEPETKQNEIEKMPVLSGNDDLITSFDISSLDLSKFGINNKSLSNRSDISDMASTNSQRSSHSMRSSRSSISGSGKGGSIGANLVMVEGSNGSVYVVEDVTDTTSQQESSYSTSGTRSQAGGYQIGSTGDVRIDSKVDDATAHQVISALYGLTEGGNSSSVIGDTNSRSIGQNSVVLRSSGGSVNNGVISLPGNVLKEYSDDNNTTRDVKEHETLTIHGVTSDNVALIEHRVQKTITKRKDVEDANGFVSSSAGNELTIDTGSTDYSVVGYNQRSTQYAQPMLVTAQQGPTSSNVNSYTTSAMIVPQPMLVTTQQAPTIDLGNSAVKTYTTSTMMVPQLNDMSTVNFSNSAFQPYNSGTQSGSSITDKYVGTTTEYTLGNNLQTQSNYVKPIEPTTTSYHEVQELLNGIDRPKPMEDKVTTISNKKEESSKKEKDDETNYYSKTTTTTTLIPPYEVDSVYGSKSSRTTSEESPRDDDGHLYRVVRASMSPRRSPSPKSRPIYHEVGPRRRSPSPIHRSRYHDIGRPSRFDTSRSDKLSRFDMLRSNTDISDRYVDSWRRNAYGSEPRLDRFSYKYPSSSDINFYDGDRKVRVAKTYASNNSSPTKRRNSSGFLSSDSESDRNVTRIKIRDNSYPSHSYRSKHGYESDDEIGRLYRVSNRHDYGSYDYNRPHSVMSDDQVFRTSRLSAPQSPFGDKYRSFNDVYSSSLHLPEHHKRYKVVHTGRSEGLGSYKKGNSFSTSRLDSGYFEPEYTTKTTRVKPSRTHTSTLSPTRNSTIINLNRSNSETTSPTRGESLYRVVNVTPANDNKMRKSRRRKSGSFSENSDSGGENSRDKFTSSKHVERSRIKENGTNHDSQLFIQKSFSPTPVSESFHSSRSRNASQEPVFRTRSPSPTNKYKTSIDVRRDYTDKLSRSVSDVGRDRNYVVYNTRSTERPKASEIFMTDKNYRMRSLSPTADMGLRGGYLPNGYNKDVPNGDVVTSSSYEKTENSYKVDNEAHMVDTGENKDLKVVRGQILIKNRIDRSKDENDIDDNVNIFDNFFHLQKDNPLYQSDPDIYKSFEEQTLKKKTNLGDELNINQDITFETVERLAKKHERQNQAQRTTPKKQNLSQLLLSKIEKLDSKDIRQHIDVKHTNEEIFGDLEFIHADGTSGSSNDTKNFDSVSENVDLTLRDGKAFVIITVNAERITPIDYEFNVWRKSAAIVTRQIEIDLFANDQRRRLYHHVMETTRPQGSIEDGSYVRRNSRTGEEEKVLNSAQTLKLFSEILNVTDDTDDEADYNDLSVKTRQMQGQGQLPASEEIDFMY